MPIFVLAARLCPKGMEATMYATIMSFLNLGGVVSVQLGANFYFILKKLLEWSLNYRPCTRMYTHTHTHTHAHTHTHTCVCVCVSHMCVFVCVYKVINIYMKEWRGVGATLSTNSQKSVYSGFTG
jgi:hypothetical protein